jgi:hypothetical protein
MRVKVDQPRRDDAPSDVAYCFALKACSKLSHATVAKTDIHDGIDSLGRIDDAPAAQDEIKGHVAHSLARWNFRALSDRLACVKKDRFEVTQRS